ncbi:MAG: PilZ domain-containing protein [Desulfobacterales bacterium]|jgi:c-di-GMP-binding flagellar brake protein YcgR
MRSERRKYTRFQAQDTAYAAVGAGFSHVGRLIDISIGGLALEYLTDDDARLMNSPVDIFVRGAEFHLSRLPCKIIYNRRLGAPGKTRSPARGLIRKRCGVEFKSLAEIHKKQLEAFLRDHIVGVAEDHIYST